MLLIKVAERMDDDGKDRDHELEEFIVKMCNQRFMFREKIMTLILAHIKPLPSSAIAHRLLIQNEVPILVEFGCVVDALDRNPAANQLSTDIGDGLERHRVTDFKRPQRHMRGHRR